MPGPTNAELDAVKQLFDARINGVNDSIQRMEGVIERLAVAVEKQAEQNIALAVLTTRFNSHIEVFDAHKTAVNAALKSHSDRIGSVAKSANRTTLRVNSARAAMIAAVAFAGEALIHNWHHVWAWLTGA